MVIYGDGDAVGSRLYVHTYIQAVCQKAIIAERYYTQLLDTHQHYLQPAAKNTRSSPYPPTSKYQFILVPTTRESQSAPVPSL